MNNEAYTLRNCVRLYCCRCLALLLLLPFPPFYLVASNIFNALLSVTRYSLSLPLRPFCAPSLTEWVSVSVTEITVFFFICLFVVEFIKWLINLIYSCVRINMRRAMPFTLRSRHTRLVQRHRAMWCAVIMAHYIFNKNNNNNSKNLAVIYIILRLAESLNISISTIMQHYNYFIDIYSYIKMYLLIFDSFFWLFVFVRCSLAYYASCRPLIFDAVNKTFTLTFTSTYMRHVWRWVARVPK